MKNYKKIIVSLILCTAVIFSFTGCIIDSGSGDEDTGSEMNAENTVSSVDKAEEKPLVSIEETVCLEEKDVKITAKKISEDKIFGQTLDFTIENNSAQTYDISITKVIVNNCMTSASAVETVAAGKKVNTEVNIKTDELKAAGIDNVGQFELYFRISDSDKYDEYYKSKTPFVLKTSCFDEMDAEPDRSGNEIYNAMGLKIAAKDIDENSFWGKALVLFIENNSEKDYTIRAKDISVNGFMVDEYMSETVNAGKFALADLEIFGSSLEDNGIEEIEEIELKFEIYAGDDFMDKITTDPIKITF